MQTVTRSKPQFQTPRPSAPRTARISAKAQRCRGKFLRMFPKGFHDDDYVGLERNYKWAAHARWTEELNQKIHRKLLREHTYDEIAARAATIEGRTNLIFSYEKMAMRDALKLPTGAEAFAKGLYNMLYGPGPLAPRFERWCSKVADLPRKQSRVFTWPNVTVFGFIAQPDTHIFIKPTVMRRAAEAYGFDFKYESRPSWRTYENMLAFAEAVRNDLHDLRPRDMIDIQSFLWIQGSDEYAE